VIVLNVYLWRRGLPWLRSIRRPQIQHTQPQCTQRTLRKYQNNDLHTHGDLVVVPHLFWAFRTSAAPNPRLKCSFSSHCLHVYLTQWPPACIRAQYLASAQIPEPSGGDSNPSGPSFSGWLLPGLLAGPEHSVVLGHIPGEEAAGRARWTVSPTKRKFILCIQPDGSTSYWNCPCSALWNRKKLSI